MSFFDFLIHRLRKIFARSFIDIVCTIHILRVWRLMRGKKQKHWNFIENLSFVTTYIWSMFQKVVNIASHLYQPICEACGQAVPSKKKAFPTNSRRKWRSAYLTKIELYFWSILYFHVKWSANILMIILVNWSRLGQNRHATNKYLPNILLQLILIIGAIFIKI